MGGSPLSVVLELNLKDLIHLVPMTSTYKSTWHIVNAQQILVEGINNRLLGNVLGDNYISIICSISPQHILCHVVSQ